MGGGGSKHHHHTHVVTQYVQDPSVSNQLEQSRNQVKALTDKIGNLEQKLNEAFKKAKNPHNYKELKKQIFDGFLNNLQTLSFQQKIPKKQGQRHFVLIGNISAGKSSLINYACGTKLAVGVGQTTDCLSKVASSKSNKVHIWDSPGVNEDFQFYDPDVLAYFHSADRIFILYPDSLKSCKEMIQVLYKIKPSNTFLVRTQCDRGDKGQSKTIAQELATDKELLKTWKIQLPVLATSTIKSADYMDNAKFYKLILGKSKFVAEKDHIYIDKEGWIRILTKIDDEIMPQFKGALTAQDIKDMEIVDIGWSDNIYQMNTEYSWYMNNAAFTTTEGLDKYQAIANIFNGKTPTGTDWSIGYEGGYLYYDGIIQTYGNFKSFYMGCQWKAHITIGTAVSLRSGGGQHHSGEFIHSSYNGYSIKQHSITSRIGWKNTRVFWIRVV